MLLFKPQVRAKLKKTKEDEAKSTRNAAGRTRAMGRRRGAAASSPAHKPKVLWNQTCPLYHQTII